MTEMLVILSRLAVESGGGVANCFAFRTQPSNQPYQPAPPKRHPQTGVLPPHLLLLQPPTGQQLLLKFYD